MLKRLPAGILFVLPVLLASGPAAAETPSPVALLRGVEAARDGHDAFKAVVEINEVSPPAETVECHIEMDGDKRRSEVFIGGASREVVIRDGDEFRGYRRKANEDVHLYGVDRATAVRGDLAFDPRVLGLSDLLTCDLKVNDCLWYDEQEDLEVAGQERLRGVDVWKVKATRDQDVSEYWIEEPSFRVHRRTITTQGLRIEVDSEFDPADPRSPYPRRVVARREGGESPREHVYTVKSFEIDPSVPSERFTLASMGLPVNTAVVDYRISRTVGYWDGEGLSATPIYTGERPEAPTPAPLAAAPVRPWLIVVNAAFVLGILAFLWRRRRAAA